jgi:hypothetical protein
MRAGALIIGSLFWERNRWKKNALCFDDARQAPFPIRYGRESQSRDKAYTMVLCSSTMPPPSMATPLGMAQIVPFQRKVHRFKDVLHLAHLVAEAEKNGADSKLSWSWGCVGLLEPPGRATFEAKWRKKMSATADKIVKAYRRGEAPLNNDAIINADLWTNVGTQGIDLLLCAVTKPKPKQSDPPSPLDIAVAMGTPPGNKGYEYFVRNSSNGIVTYQDTEIVKQLKLRFTP